MVTFRINVNIYKLTTGTLTWENIESKAEYEASKRGLLNTPILSVKGSTAITA